MIGAGQLTERWTFQQRGLDANGDRRGPWEAPGVTLWARVIWLRGSEAVQQDRLTGLQPVVITVRASSLTRDIDAGWRAQDSRKPSRVGDIKSVEPSREGRGFIDILAVIGAGQG